MQARRHDTVGPSLGGLARTASQTLAIKGRAYGVPSVRVDGNDLLAVVRVLREAIDRARAGGGPTFVEALTYRMGAHSTSDDPSRYRSQEEVDGWAKDRDPNTAFSSSVLPLPFHAMSRYPYPVTEHYPRDAAHDDYQRTYNTRPARELQ